MVCGIEKAWAGESLYQLLCRLGHREPQPVVLELLCPDFECRFACRFACLCQHVSSMHFFYGRQLRCAPQYFEVQMYAVLHEPLELAPECLVVRDELGDGRCLGVEL